MSQKTAFFFLAADHASRLGQEHRIGRVEAGRRQIAPTPRCVRRGGVVLYGTNVEPNHHHPPGSTTDPWVVWNQIGTIREGSEVIPRGS